MAAKKNNTYIQIVSRKRKMQVVIYSRIMELTERPPRFKWVRDMSSNWKAVIVVAVAALTLKIAAEQIIMLIVRH